MVESVSGVVERISAISSSDLRGGSLDASGRKIFRPDGKTTSPTHRKGEPLCSPGSRIAWAALQGAKDFSPLVSNHQYILGIDVVKAKLDIALLLPDGKFRSEVIPNTVLDADNKEVS